MSAYLLEVVLLGHIFGTTGALYLAIGKDRPVLNRAGRTVTGLGLASE